jgi:hypothetical protein
MWDLRFYFSSERNLSPGPGLNPRIVGPMASTVTITPPRRLVPTYLETDVYTSNLEVELTLFVMWSIGKPFWDTVTIADLLAWVQMSRSIKQMCRLQLDMGSLNYRLGGSCGHSPGSTDKLQRVFLFLNLEAAYFQYYDPPT